MSEDFEKFLLLFFHTRVRNLQATEQPRLALGKEIAFLHYISTFNSTVNEPFLPYVYVSTGLGFIYSIATFDHSFSAVLITRSDLCLRAGKNEVGRSQLAPAESGSSPTRPAEIMQEILVMERGLGKKSALITNLRRTNELGSG